MKRYVLTGAPGAGKTVLVRELAARGYAVVPEAATDVIARTQARGVDESGPALIDEIVALQRARQEAPVPRDVMVQLFDRSPICTLALAGECGFELVEIPAAAVPERVAMVMAYLSARLAA